VGLPVKQDLPYDSGAAAIVAVASYAFIVVTFPDALRNGTVTVTQSLRSLNAVA
jgi:hypothetical protein